jgi:hypothetical protein
MDEEVKTQTLEEQMELAHKLLDEFESIHNLTKPTVPNETEAILELTHPQLEKLGAVECAEYAYQLAQYSYYIQRVYNKESASLKWLKDKLDYFVASKWENYDSFTKYEIRGRLIARDNAVVTRLLKLISYTEQKIERLSFLGTTISKMSDKLENLQKAKSYQRG